MRKLKKIVQIQKRRVSAEAICGYTATGHFLPVMASWVGNTYIHI